MKIRAKYRGSEITIIGFVSALSNEVKAVYVNHNGTVSSCYLDYIEILDKNYIPTEG